MAFTDGAPNQVSFELAELIGEAEVAGSIEAAARHVQLTVGPTEPGVLLTGDACYWLEHAKKERVPGVVWNPTLAMHSIKRINTLARLLGARIFPGHDPEFWKTVTPSPDAYR